MGALLFGAPGFWLSHEGPLVCGAWGVACSSFARPGDTPAPGRLAKEQVLRYRLVRPEPVPFQKTCRGKFGWNVAFVCFCLFGLLSISAWMFLMHFVFVSKPPIFTWQRLMFSFLRVDLKWSGIFIVIFKRSAFLVKDFIKKNIVFLALLSSSFWNHCSFLKYGFPSHWNSRPAFASLILKDGNGRRHDDKNSKQSIFEVLKIFFGLENYTKEQILLFIAVHFTFVLSGVLLAFMDSLTAKTKSKIK